jgi:prefoldin alpha subunit
MTEKNKMPAHEEELRRKAIQFQLLQAHLGELSKKQELVAERLNELSRAKTALEELETVKPGDTVMIPLGGDNFVQGKITDAKSILVSIGSGVAVKKPKQAAAEILDSRVTELDGLLNGLIAEAQAVSAQLARMRTELERPGRQK